MLYEIMTILPSQYADTEVDGVIGTVTKVIEKSGAKVEKTHSFGKIKMAYPIERQRYGTYILFYVTAEAEMMMKLDSDLRLTDEILRHMSIARPEGMPKGEFKLVQYTPPLTTEGRRAGEREERSDRPDRGPRTQAADASGKVTTEELSNKLDQILDSDIMKNI
ncbi:MAG: 30S ribosomal protein S6 [Patescibacteria group bacterium]